jgi:hypothetical protein
MSRNDANVRAFAAALDQRFAEVDEKLTEIFRESISAVVENIVDPGEYGPGVPVDTGALKNSFAIGIGGPGADGDAAVSIGAGLLASVRLRDSVFFTSHLSYAEWVELGRTRNGGQMQRRTSAQRLGRLKGTGGPTTFLQSVLDNWRRIVEDAVQRVGEP